MICKDFKTRNKPRNILVQLLSIYVKKEMIIQYY